MASHLYKLLKTFSRVEQLILGGATLIFLTTGIIYIASFIDKKTVLLPEAGGTYREGMLTQPVYVNPVISNGNDADRDVIALTYSSVTDLADSITVSDNHQAWTIRLKDNIYFSDGVRLTADDILFTLHAIQNPDANSPLFATWQGVTAERVSELELTLHTGVPYAFFKENLGSLYVVPKHIFSEVPVANWRQSDYNLQPIGSGPYKVDSFKKEKNGFISEYYLIRNDRYFKERPLMDNITFVFFTDLNDALEAFNVARIDALSGVDPLLLSHVKRPHSIATLRLPRYYAVFLNQNSIPLLKNQALRRALNYATNKKEIVDGVFNGDASLIDGPTPFTHGSKASALTPYDPNQAEKLLDAAKLTRGSDGFRGEIKLVVPQLDFLIKTADILKSNWEAIGIKTTLLTLDLGTVNNQAIKNRDYDAILFGNIFATNPDMFSFWHSSERFYPGLNLSLYNSKPADKLMETVRKDFNDDARAQKLDELITLIRTDAPAVFLYSPNYLYLTNNKVRGFNDAIINTPSNRFGNISEWYIKTKRVFR